MAVLWLDAWTAVAVSFVMGLLILVLRLGFRRGLRGVKGNRPAQDWAEVTYAVAGAASLTLGWALLGDKWQGILPIAFMAWGDSMCGLARATRWPTNLARLYPSMAKLGVCLAAAAVFQTYWIGATGAVVAVAAERRRPMVLKIWDDNLSVVAASLGVLAVLAAVTG